MWAKGGRRRGEAEVEVDDGTRCSVLERVGA